MVVLGSTHVKRLDDVVSPALLAARKVVKMDVEGYEALVIGGAERFLTEGQPPVAMLIEVSRNQSSFTRHLAKFGYERVESYGNNFLYRQVWAPQKRFP